MELSCLQSKESTQSKQELSNIANKNEALSDVRPNGGDGVEDESNVDESGADADPDAIVNGCENDEDTPSPVEVGGGGCCWCCWYYPLWSKIDKNTDKIAI